MNSEIANDVAVRTVDGNAPTASFNGDMTPPMHAWFSVNQFYAHEASLLDHQRMDEWLALLDDEIIYRAPVRVTRRRGEPTETEMLLFDENRRSLGLRVRRLSTDVAWSEDPPSRTRRMVSNVMVRPGVDSSTWDATSGLLVYRNRADHWQHDLISAERTDQLVVLADGSLRIRQRTIVFDQTTLGTKNLGLFF
jgi:PAH dioxygenase small subunit